MTVTLQVYPWKVALTWGLICFLLLSNHIPFDLYDSLSAHEEQNLSYSTMLMGLYYQYIPAIILVLVFLLVGYLLSKRVVQLNGIYVLCVGVWLTLFYFAGAIASSYYAYLNSPYLNRSEVDAYNMSLFTQLPYLITDILPNVTIIIVVCSYAMVREINAYLVYDVKLVTQ